MKLQFLVFHMDTRFEKEEIKYSGPRKIFARFSPEFGLCRSFRKFLSESTTTWLVNDHKNSFSPHLYPTYWHNASIPKTRSGDSKMLFFTSARTTTEWWFSLGSRIYINEINSTTLAIRQPSPGLTGWRIRTRQPSKHWLPDLYQWN